MCQSELGSSISIVSRSNSGRVHSNKTRICATIRKEGDYNKSNCCMNYNNNNENNLNSNKNVCFFCNKAGHIYLSKCDDFKNRDISW